MSSTASPVNAPDILVVDDTPDNIRFLAAMLKDQGYNVRPAINGNIALRAVHTAIPDLILLDINMPGMDGYTVCQQLKTDPQTSEIPVIFLSALNDPSDKVKAFEAGGADYISKPFYIDEILVRIRHQLALRNLQQRLEERNTELHQTITQLQKTQAQLIQNEKMMALNQLVAGIAHEINNPISFIYGNLGYANNYIHELLEIVQLYRQEYPQPSARLQERIEEIELDFLKEDLPSVLDSMQNGAERIRKIVLGLQTFSRFNEKGRKLTDIHSCLDSTLHILEHRLRASNHTAIAIEKRYGAIPAIVCEPGAMNQVFFHLISNSIDAIRAQEAKAPVESPTITLTTQLQAAQLCILVTDNGIGIAPEHQPRLFDPFFTTKAIGQGTGLGLSLCYQIVVVEHEGELTFESEEGQGTEFQVKISSHLSV